MKCYPCLSPGIKKYLKEAVDSELHQMIDEMPTCPTGEVLTLCPVSAEPTKTGPRIKRPRSAYQEHISQCMKAKPIKGKPFGAASQYLKECAIEWKQRKQA